VTGDIVELVIGPGGMATCLYSEDLDLARLGEVRVRRVSHCETDEQGQWWADLSPVTGPKLGPFGKRSQALDAEVQWLRRHVLGTAENKEIECVES
jgi:hypothetical protein